MRQGFLRLAAALRALRDRCALVSPRQLALPPLEPLAFRYRATASFGEFDICRIMGILSTPRQ